MKKQLKIAHISDIHWLGIERHDEYKEIFYKVFESLRTEDVDAIIITGDIFHTKTHGLTPEVIQNISWMFQELSELAPVYTILGNHDGNLKNEHREDSISPIINAINHNNGKTPITLMKKSGNYPLVGKQRLHHSVPPLLAYLSVFSCFDTEGWTKNFPQRQPNNLPAIALYHGSVAGCMVDNSHILEETEVEPNIFEGYDFCLLGDIHKRQGLSERKTFSGTERAWMAYAGSLIQQNFGEEEQKGYLIWEIENRDSWDVRFVHIPNRFGFVTVPWQGTPEATISKIAEVPVIENKNIRIKTTQKLTPAEKQVVENYVREAGALDFVAEDGGGKKITTAQAGSVNIQKHSLRTDPAVLASLYSEYLKQNLALYSLTEDQVAKAKLLLASYMDKVNETDVDGSVRDVIWSLKNLQFSNLYRYDENNEIRFENLRGIAYIAGKNMVGKSSIIGSLTYSLFNATDRGPVKSFHIVNSKKQQGKATAVFSVGGSDYATVRTTTKRGKLEDQKAATTLNFYKIEGKERVEVVVKNDDTRPDTDKSVRKLIGTIQDFILTSFINDDTLKEYINQGSTQRKEILNKFLDLDVFSQLYKLANADLAVLKNKTATHAGIDFEKTVKETEEILSSLELSIRKLEEELEELQRNKLGFQSQNELLREHSRLSEDKMKTSSAVVSLERTLSDIQKNLKAVKTEIEMLEVSIVNLETTIAQIDEEKLLQIKEKTNFLAKEVLETEKRFGIESNKLETQKKSVRRLDVVPCGDQFPNCGFIKDSHENKGLIQAQQELVENLNSGLNTLQEELESWKNKRADFVLKTLQTKKTELVVAKTSLLEKRKTLVLYEKQLQTTSQNLEQKNLDLQEIEQKLSSISNVEGIKEELRKLSTEIIKKQETIRNGYIQIGTLKTKIETLMKEKILVSSLVEQQKILESVVAAFHKNGIPALILQSQLPQLNEELNSILSGISKFKLSVETEPNSNTLDIFLEDEHSRRLIELASGAEKTLTSIALRVALYNLTSLPKSDILIIDEGFGALDADSMDSCLKLLNLLKSKFRLILIIAHQPQVKEIADIILEITPTKDLHSHIELV